MSWYVRLTGDRQILDNLGFENNSIIAMRGGDYFLDLAEFACDASLSEIKKIASEYLNTLNGILYFQDSVPSAIRIDLIYKVNEDGSQNLFLTPEPAVIHLQGYAPTITITSSSGETTVITPYEKTFSTLQKARASEPLQRIFREISNGDFDFPTLYKIIDILLSLKGAQVYKWVPKKKINLLKRTSQKDRHGVNRHHPPPKPMSLSEAQEITRILIEKYLAELR
jgi:hypothetical protein